MRSVRRITNLIFAAALLALPLFAQELPKEIRGYKVQKTEISIKTSADKARGKSGPEAVVRIGDPSVVDASLTGITFELPAEITAYGQSGRVDFITFHDFKINGLSVDVEEYRSPFDFKKNELVVLPKPARIFLPSSQVLKAGWKEMTGSKKQWTVTGRVFVFGKYRKMGLNFKRVVPVDITLQIQNPLLQYRAKITG